MSDVLNDGILEYVLTRGPVSTADIFKEFSDYSKSSVIHEMKRLSFAGLISSTPNGRIVAGEKDANSR